MPHVDKRSGELVIRIVYDGAPEAGKTTNVEQLTSMIALQRRGAVGSPGTRGPRTEFFDWLDFSGGFIDGRRVRCQLVSVPGQVQLLHRRRYLLEGADAVVFVADSRREYVDECRQNLAATRRMLDKIEAKVPVGVIVQANKQDLPGALAPEELGRALELPTSVAVLPSVAPTGQGIMQTFILATRLATDRVRSMIYNHALPDVEIEHETPQALFEAMTQLEPTGATEAKGLPAEADETNTVSPVPLEPGGRRNEATPELGSGLVPDLEVSAGHVWPPVKGRAVLASANFSDFRIPEFVAPWAPAEAFELEATGGWVFHTAERWLFDEEARARVELLSIVRRQLEVSEFIPETRALFLAAEGTSWRLWVLTGRTQTLDEAMIEALARRDIQAVRGLLHGAREFSNRLKDVFPGAQNVGPASVSLVGRRPAFLALHEDSPPEGRADIPTRLREVALNRIAEDPGVRDWLEGHGGIPASEVGTR
jgi:signal recognition particle receptor subunit beta